MELPSGGATEPKGGLVQHKVKKNRIIFPNHGSQEMGKGMEKRILKDAGIQ